MTGLGSSCGACKFLRRKCTHECVFAPYFCYDEAVNHFAAVHKVFGASNVSKLLLHLPIQNRSDAAITMSYEALARIQNPVYGCVAHIFSLQQQVASLQEEIEVLVNQMGTHTVEVPNCGDLQTETYSDDNILFTSMDETMSTLYYQDEQAALPNPQGLIPTNQVPYSQLCENSVPLSFKRVEDQMFLSSFDQNSPEINFDGLESRGLIDDLCMGNTGIPTNWEVPIWE